MKKIIVLLVFSLAISLLMAESLDSLKAKRERLYQKYSDLNIPGKELNKENQTKSIAILKDIVIVDTRIIKENADFDKKVHEYEKTIKTLNTDNDTLTKLNTACTGRMMMIYICGGVLVVLMIIAIVLSMVFYAKYRAQKKCCK